MRQIACIISLVAALFLVSACGAIPEDNQPPFSAAELDKFVADVPHVIDAMQKAAFKCSKLPLEEGNKFILAARHKEVRRLGWDIDRFYHLLQCTRDVLSLEILSDSIAALESKAGDVIASSDRTAIRKKIKKQQAVQQTTLIRFESITTVAERVFLNERLNKIRSNYNHDIVIQPYKHF